LSIIAELESSLIQDARDLQSTCEGILASGSVEQVSYLFDPPSVLTALANLDLDVLNEMDRALLQSGYLPGRPSTPVPQVELSEIIAPVAGPSSSARCTSLIVVDQPPVEFLAQSSPVREVHAESPEEDELTMSGVEDAAGNVVEDAGKGAVEGAADI
jgi:hypothetical protein